MYQTCMIRAILDTNFYYLKVDVAGWQYPLHKWLFMYENWCTTNNITNYSTTHDITIIFKFQYRFSYVLYILNKRYHILPTPSTKHNKPPPSKSPKHIQFFQAITKHPLSHYLHHSTKVTLFQILHGDITVH